ncbi:MAG: hypothetical protein IBJ19_04285 [Gemmatimonadaceae bacterium]|nr:hypothetical protein [Gemmatimonadaceae bacterium]
MTIFLLFLLSVGRVPWQDRSSVTTRALIVVGQTLKNRSGAIVETGKLGVVADSILRHAVQGAGQRVVSPSVSALRVRLLSTELRGADTAIVRLNLEQCDPATRAWFRNELQYVVVSPSRDLPPQIRSRLLRKAEDGTCNP